MRITATITADFATIGFPFSSCIVFVVLSRDTCEVVKTLVKSHFSYEKLGFSGIRGLQNDFNTPKMAPKIEIGFPFHF